MCVCLCACMCVSCIPGSKHSWVVCDYIPLDERNEFFFFKFLFINITILFSGFLKSTPTMLCVFSQVSGCMRAYGRICGSVTRAAISKVIGV